MKNILIVDDHPVVRSGISAIIGRDEGFRVCCEAGSESEVMKAIASSRFEPDLAIIDLSLSQESGFGLFRKLLGVFPALRVLVFSLYDENVYAEKVIKEGAHGYLMKGEPPEKLIEAIHTVLDGRLYVSNAIHESMLAKLAQPQGGSTNPVSSLSKVELVVLELIGQGLTIRQISEKLHRSPKTIDVHRAHIKQKLNLPSNTALIQFAIQWNAPI